MATPKRRMTKKQRKGQVLHVRSHSAVKAFESALGKGPLTLVYINAKWCGACHKFNDEVWSHLTKLKNRSVNLASVDSEMIGKTSLANVPRKFYPTLMLVGKDKKPATFEDEEGNPTNAMPRNNTLSEDREALSNLVRNPTVKPNMSASMSSTMSPSMAASMSPTMSPSMNHTMAESIAASMSPTMNRSMAASLNRTLAASMNPTMAASMSPTLSPAIAASMNALARSNSPRRANVTKKSLARSPFEPLDNLEETSNTPRTVSTMELNSTSKQMGNRPSRHILTSTPPNPASDLVASQTKSPTPTASFNLEPVKKGGMLNAIRERVASLNSMLNLRSSTHKNL